jgi:hypothetical protein
MAETAKVHMYEEVVKTWNPHVGCLHKCIYCIPSFQKQAKRQKNKCQLCYQYVPHFHEERLKQPLPKSGLVFACDLGDICFATHEQRELIINRMKDYPNTTFLLQSKNPKCFLEHDFPNNVILGTTIESNQVCFNTPSQYTRYTEISNALFPRARVYYMMRSTHLRKAITIEPILDFNFKTMIDWVKWIEPEIVWVGYDNWNYHLPEPRVKKFDYFVYELSKLTKVIVKTRRKAWYED